MPGALTAFRIFPFVRKPCVPLSSNPAVHDLTAERTKELPLPAPLCILRKEMKGMCNQMEKTSASVPAKRKGYSPMQWVHMVITLALMFLFGYLPPFATVTPLGMKLLGVFIGVIYGYSACGDIIWPSLFAIIAFGISGYSSMAQVITNGLGHNVVFQSIVGFVAAGSLSYYGFGKWFVRWSLSKPIFKKSPMLYVWAFFVIFGLSCVVVNQIVLSLILYGIWNDIADNCGYDEKSGFRYVGFAGVMLCTVLGGGMIPYQSWMLGLANNWSASVGTQLNMGVMACITIPTTVLIITAYVFISKWIFKIDYSKMQRFDETKLGEDSKIMRPRVKRILIVYCLTVIICILGNTLIGTGLATFVNNTLTVAGCYCICAAILLILPSGEGDGQPCIVFKDVKNTAISWEVILMCAVTLPLSSAVTSEGTGVVPWISGVFAPIFAGKGPGFILVFTIIVSMILTNLGSNIAFGSALIPIIAPFTVAAGMNPTLAGAALVYMVNVGLILPGASAPAAIFHSQPTLPDGGMRIKTATVGALSVLVVGIPVFLLVNLLVH